MRKCLLMLFAGALAITSEQVPAQDSETIADVRCLIVGFRVSALTDPAQHSAGLLLSMYYIGRLEGRVPSLNLEDIIVKEISGMTPTDFSSEAMRCGTHLTEKGQEITRIGQDLIERGKKMSEGANK